MGEIDNETLLPFSTLLIHSCYPCCSRTNYHICYIGTSVTISSYNPTLSPLHQCDPHHLYGSATFVLLNPSKDRACLPRLPQRLTKISTPDIRFWCTSLLLRHRKWTIERQNLFSAVTLSSLKERHGIESMDTDGRFLGDCEDSQSALLLFVGKGALRRKKGIERVINMRYLYSAFS